MKTNGRGSLSACLPTVSSFVALPAHGATPLTVDLLAPLGPAKQVASGSLYGVPKPRPQT